MSEHENIDLVAFQRRLNESLEGLHAGGSGAELIGFRSGGRGWLARLDDLSEIESLPPAEKIFRLALAKDWVGGLASFKGAIHTVVDFQGFLGGPPTREGPGARALIIHPRHGIQAALLVGEVAGLISSESLIAVEADGSGLPWAKARRRTPDGEVWTMIEMGALAGSEEMINIGK